LIVSLFANQTKSPQNKVYDTFESFLLEYFRKRSFRGGVGPSYTLRKFLLSKVSFTNRTISYFYCKSFLSHTVICDWPVRIGRSFMGTNNIGYSRYEWLTTESVILVL